jgi:ribonucleoside-diphosphate reductase alpha subunit
MCNPINNETLTEFIMQTGADVFGIACCVHQMTGQNTTQLLFASPTIGKMFKHLFGEHFDGKKMWAPFYQMSHKYIYAFASGLISTDGCVSKDGNIMLELTNISMIQSTYHLMRIHGIDASINIKKRPGQKDTACIQFPYVKEILSRVNKTYTDDRINKIIAKHELPGKKYKNQTSAHIVDGQKFLKVASIIPTDRKPEKVYTLGVAGDHSYNVEGLCVQNCFLLGTGDSIEDINWNLRNASIISKWAGGIGIHMSNIRPRGARIEGTNGESTGLPQQLKIYNEAALAWNQGGKRKGAFAIWLEPWHGDFLSFLRLKLQNGAETERARDLFYGSWTPDLFMERVAADTHWSFFGESTAPGLSDVYDGMMVCTKCGWCRNVDYQRLVKSQVLVLSGYEKPYFRDGNWDYDSCCDSNPHTFQPKNIFTELYTRYESEGRAIEVIPARKVEEAIFEVQRDSGTPYVCYKDHANRQSNQQNIGTIKSSNLCCEIIEYSSKDSYACCTLASMNLRKFVVPVNGALGASRDGAPSASSPTSPPKYTFDFDGLHEATRVVARNLDIIVEINDYPVPECEGNAKGYRPIGIGVQGLADVFIKMRIPFISEEAKKLDLAIFETIYHAALEESMERAKVLGPYSAWDGCPASQGLLRFDLWMQNQIRIGSPLVKSSGPDLTTINIENSSELFSGRYNWNALRADVQKYGLRNSLLVAPMPTVSTAQILGNNESFEPLSSVIYTKTTLAGKMTYVCTDMIRHLMELGLWNERMKDLINANDGSIQAIAEIPAEVREIYKTVWEIPQSELITRAALRSAFIDQSQSLNIYLQDNSNKFLRAVMRKGYSLGLITGSYYIRTRPAGKAMGTNLRSVGGANVDNVGNTTAPVSSAIPNIAAAKKRPECEPGCDSCAL